MAVRNGFRRTILVGSEYLDNPPSQPDSTGIILQGDRGSFVLTEDMQSKGILLLGTHGCGKTRVMCKMLEQTISNLTDNDCVVIFDSKGDYCERFFRPDNPRHILISPTDRSGLASSWSIFDELFDSDGSVNEKSKLVAQEIAEALCADIKSTSQPFFGMAAADIFKMILFCTLADAVKSRNYADLNNEWLQQYLAGFNVRKLYEKIADHKEYSYIGDYVGDPNHPTTQSLGVLGYKNTLTYKTFVGNFGKLSNRGQFSMRRLMREKGGRVIFLRFDVGFSRLLSPVFSLLYELAIREALSVGTGNAYFFCDEMNLIPGCCKEFENANNFGRSRGVKVFAGLQNINQLYSASNEYDGRSIAAGFSTAICYNAVDSETRQYISERSGKTYEAYSYGGNIICRDGYTISDSDIRECGVGDAFIDLPGYPIFRFHFV